MLIGVGGALAAELVTPSPEAHLEPALLEVKFRDDAPVRLRGGQLRDIRPGGTALQNVRAARVLADLQARGAVWRRSHAAVTEAQLERLRRGPDLNAYFRVQLPAGADAAALGKALAALEEVEAVYRVPRPPPPPAAPDYTSPANPSGFWQRYLDAAPVGVDARFAWSNELTAAGVKICDVEYDWNTTHVDLPPFSRLGGTPLDPGYGNDHGTAVLGELASRPNGSGARGIAYGAVLRVASPYAAEYGYNIAAAIVAVLTNLVPGDVILLEQQMYGPTSQFVPVEWYKPTYDAIRTAVSNGVIVVEAGGNGGQDLDSSTYTTGNGNHWPFQATNDSGALIVGAGAPPTYASPRSRLSFSSYGSTLDLQGYGEDVVTTGYGDLYSSEGTNAHFTQSFSGTSSASPIVAGAAAVLQQAWKKRFNRAASPAQIRTLLRNTGTAQQGSGNIGPLPNLRAAIQAVTSAVDTDADGVPDVVDNCPTLANADQADADGDGVGDGCDPCSQAQPTWMPGVAPASPVVAADPAGQNEATDAFDFSTAGGAAGTRFQCGFGDFGRVYVNHDATYLYVGAEGADVAGDNNAMLLFLGLNTLSDDRLDLTGESGLPNALDALHNLSFSVPMDIALVLGDEYGDGTYTNFNFGPAGGGYNFGQGIYYLSATSFVPVAGTTLSQFDGGGTNATGSTDADGDRRVNRWEARIPWSSLNAAQGITSVTQLFLGGVMVSDGVSAAERYLSANYLGAATANSSGPDGFGNYGFGYVTLVPWTVSLVDVDADRTPDAWEQQHYGTITNGPESDTDGDGFTLLQEYIAATHPTNGQNFQRLEIGPAGTSNGWKILFGTATGRLYRIDVTTNLAPADWQPLATNVPGTGLALEISDTNAAQPRFYRNAVKLGP